MLRRRFLNGKRAVYETGTMDEYCLLYTSIVLLQSFKDYYYGYESVDGKPMPGYVAVSYTHLVSNGPFKKEKGTFINKGTISGNGSLPDDLKQKPDSITGYTAEISENYKENMSINVPSLAGIHKPVNAGNLQYELAE